ncbi:unnamed protein product, partial [Cladocopium goreaui]
EQQWVEEEEEEEEEEVFEDTLGKGSNATGNVANYAAEAPLNLDVKGGKGEKEKGGGKGRAKGKGKKGKGANDAHQWNFKGGKNAKGKGGKKGLDSRVAPCGTTANSVELTECGAVSKLRVASNGAAKRRVDPVDEPGNIRLDSQAGDDGPAMRADAAAFLPGKGYVKETPEAAYIDSLHEEIRRPDAQIRSLE